MQLLEAKEIQIEWSDVGVGHYKTIFQHLYRYLARKSVRSEGIHVSDIIKDKWFGSAEGEERERKRKEVAAELQDAEIMPLLMVLGMAWELFVVGLYKQLLWQPGEVEADGVSGSPDAFGTYDGQRIVEEFKFTWKSFRNREILKETIWIWQMAAYCYMAGCRTAKLHVCWVNGDYQRGETWGPRYFVYVIRFDREELLRLWKDLFVKGKEKLSGIKTYR